MLCWTCKFQLGQYLKPWFYCSSFYLLSELRPIIHPKKIFFILSFLVVSPLHSYLAILIYHKCCFSTVQYCVSWIISCLKAILLKLPFNLKSTWWSYNTLDLFSHLIINFSFKSKMPELFSYRNIFLFNLTGPSIYF